MGLLQGGNDVGRVMIDREVREVGVGLAGGQVIVGVWPGDGEVRGPHRDAHKVEPDAQARTEEILHEGIACALAQLGIDQPGRRVGDGRAEAIHLLVFLVLVDVDRRGVPTIGAESEARLRSELVAAVAGRQPDLNGWTRGPGCEMCEKQTEYCYGDYTAEKKPNDGKMTTRETVHMCYVLLKAHWLSIMPYISSGCVAKTLRGTRWA